MSRCALNASNTLNRLLTKNGVTKTVCNMREFLFVKKINIEFGSTIVIITVSSRAVVKELLPLDFLGLRKPSTGGLPPAMVVFEEPVVKVSVRLKGLFSLVVASGNIALLFEVFGTNLGNVHINKVSVVSVHLEELVFRVKSSSLDVVAHVDVLVGKDNVGLVDGVSRGTEISNSLVGFLLVLVNGKEKVLAGDDLIVSLSNEFLLIDLLLEFNLFHFLCHNSVDLGFYFLKMAIVCFVNFHRSKYSFFRADSNHFGLVSGVGIDEHLLFGCFHVRVIND